jgi:hypothetical protein
MATLPIENSSERMGDLELPRALSASDERILSIRRAIEDNNTDRLKSLMDSLPIELAERNNTVYTLLAYLINVCSLHDRVQCLNIVLERYRSSNPMELRYSTVAMVLREEALLAYKWLLKHSDSLYIQLISELADHAPDAKTRMACHRLHEHYGYQESKFYYEVMSNVLRQGGYLNFVVYKFAQRKLRDVMPYRDKPSYILDKKLPLDEFDFPELVVEAKTFNIPSPTEYAVMSTKNLFVTGVEEDVAEERFYSAFDEYSALNTKGRVDLLKNLALSNSRYFLSDTAEALRTLGPVNALVGADLSDDDLCSKYGGCRMFTCLEWEIKDKGGGDSSSDYDPWFWFKGYCQQCNFKIQMPQYAVRIPMPLGGWKGCFCSWDCARLSLCGADAVSFRPIGVLEKKMNAVGVFNRF